jgi:hypothetical protein
MLNVGHVNSVYSGTLLLVSVLLLTFRVRAAVSCVLRVDAVTLVCLSQLCEILYLTKTCVVIYLPL